MKRKIFLLAFALVMLFAIKPALDTPVSATSGTTGDCTWSLDGTVLTVSGNGAMGDYTYAFPNGTTAPWGTSVTKVILGDGVTYIGKYAFGRCQALTEVRVGNGVTSLGYGAFYQCFGLSTINLPEGLTSIGDAAFAFSGISSIKLPDTLTYLGSGAFTTCGYLTSIEIPEGVTGIGVTTFAHSSALVSVTLPENLTSIGESAFSCCNSLASINIPEGVTAIGDSAFADCFALTSMKLPDSLEVIGSGAFSQCTGITTIQIPKNVTAIGDNAFLYCRALASVKLPDDLTSIGAGAFRGCWPLTTITIPASVKSIGSDTFNECTSLASIQIPKGVTSVGSFAFYGCTSLADVWYDGYESDKAAMSIAENNAPLEDARWHFKICTHEYSSTCDGTCDLCGAERVTLGHVYEDECYPDCKFCGERRTVLHQYTSDCDERCDLCQRRRAVSHTFTDDADPDCNECGGKRPSFLVGDLDRNGNLELDDAIYALYHVNFPNAYPAGQSVDFDGNEKNDLNDAIHLLYHVNFPDQYPLNKGFFLHWPLAEEHTGTVTSSNAQNNPFIDIDVGGWANNGKIPSLAAEDGTVVRNGYFSDWGNLVVVDHGDGYLTYYAHLASSSVSVGQKVFAGDEVGKIGGTGNTSTVKLRFLLYAPVGANNESVRVDPLNYIKKPQ